MIRSVLREVILFIACALFMGTVGLVLLDSVIMPDLVRKGEQVQVPNVVNMSPRQAEGTLARYGLILKIQEPRWDLKIPKGHLLSQNPEAFSHVKAGRTVYAVPSRGSRLYKVPDFRRKSKRQAQLLTQQGGLVLEVLNEEPSETVEEGKVLWQEPPPGRQVGAGSTVSVVFSRGPDRALVAVPDLVGKKLDEARSALKTALLDVRDVRYRFSTAYVQDTVIEHIPAAGDSVRGGAKVRLVVSKL